MLLDTHFRVSLRQFMNMMNLLQRTCRSIPCPSPVHSVYILKERIFRRLTVAIQIPVVQDPSALSVTIRLRQSKTLRQGGAGSSVDRKSVSNTTAQSLLQHPGSIPIRLELKGLQVRSRRRELLY